MKGNDYQVKVKLKNLSRLALEQKWSSINEKESVYEFEYQAKDRKKYPSGYPHFEVKVRVHFAKIPGSEAEA
jgi:hypothetical protein